MAHVFTDQTIPAHGKGKKVYIDELQTAYKQSENAVPCAIPSNVTFTATITNAAIKKAYIEGLRTAIDSLSAKFQNNCCQNNCTAAQVDCQTTTAPACQFLSNAHSSHGTADGVNYTVGNCTQCWSQC